MKLSVVTVSYNSALTIADTMRSVAGQDWPDREHIVIDGASQDGTLEVVARHADAATTIVSEPDRGIYDAMNKGLGRATGDYVCFLNSDDFFARPDALRLIARAATAEVDCIFADTQFVGADGRTTGARLYSARRFAPWWLEVGAMPPHPSMFVRRSLLNTLGGFDTRFQIAGDFDFIARAILSRQATWRLLPVTISYFRSGGVSTAGLKAKRTIGLEMADSLARLGYRFPRVRVLLRTFPKFGQFLGGAGGGPIVPFFD